jgi:uncharacterized repeat protein (TIGR01451 family)
VVSASLIDPVQGNNSASLETLRLNQADVAVALSAEPAAYLAGQALIYTLVVDNAGPDPALATQLVSVLPAALTAVAWTCTSQLGASCTSSGIGNLAESVDLPAGSSTTFEFIGTVPAATSGPLTAGATATVDAALLDPDLGNNSVSLETAEGSQAIEIFANGFED